MARTRTKTVPVAPDPDLEQLRELVMEQLDNIRARAKKTPSQPTVSWMAKGDHLVLLVVDEKGTRRFDCKILDWLNVSA